MKTHVMFLVSPKSVIQVRKSFHGSFTGLSDIYFLQRDAGLVFSYLLFSLLYCVRLFSLMRNKSGNATKTQVILVCSAHAYMLSFSAVAHTSTRSLTGKLRWISPEPESHLAVKDESKIETSPTPLCLTFLCLCLCLHSNTSRVHFL